jgi:hypothetical protein
MLPFISSLFKPQPPLMIGIVKTASPRRTGLVASRDRFILHDLILRVSTATFSLPDIKKFAGVTIGKIGRNPRHLVFDRSLAPSEMDRADLVNWGLGRGIRVEFEPLPVSVKHLLRA